MYIKKKCKLFNVPICQNHVFQTVNKTNIYFPILKSLEIITVSKYYVPF